MYTKADFVRWKLEGPKYWPVNTNGYVYIGAYNTEGHELFVNAATQRIICKDPAKEIGTLYCMSMLFEDHRLGSTDWYKVRKLYEAYQRCIQKQTS